MSQQRDLASLTETFQRLGVPDPEQWAKSEIEDGNPQLAAVVLLRTMAARMVQISDTSWLRGAGTRLVNENIRRLRSTDGDVDDLTRVVRSMQLDLLREVCAVLDDMASERFLDSDLEGRTRHVGWSLSALEDGEPNGTLEGLHEIVDDVVPN